MYLINTSIYGGWNNDRENSLRKIIGEHCNDREAVIVNVDMIYVEYLRMQKRFLKYDEI